MKEDLVQVPPPLLLTCFRLRSAFAAYSRLCRACAADSRLLRVFVQSLRKQSKGYQQNPLMLHLLLQLLQMR